MTESEEFEFRRRRESETSFSQTDLGAVTGLQMPGRGNTAAAGIVGPIAGATAMGAAAGAAAPEILTGLAGGLRQFPQGARVAPFLETAAIASKAAGRASTGIMGGVSGLGAETVGQAADAAGAGPVTGEAVRFVAGGVAPEALPVAKLVLNIVKAKLPTSFEAAAAKRLAIALAAKLEGRPQDISEQEAAFLNKLTTELRGAPSSDASQRGVYDILQAGGKQRLALGETEAAKVLSDSQKSIINEMDATLKGPVAYARTAQDRIKARGADALATAQQQRLNVGDDLELSDVGNNLRGVIVGRNQKALEARSAQFTKDEAERNAIVQGRESGGEFIQSLPEYNSLVAELKGKLLIGQKAQQQTTAPVTERGVKNAYQNIYDAVRKQRIQTGTDDEGKPIFKEFPASFEAIDDVRRKLGEVFRGKPPEGYEGISASVAREYYAKLSNIQRKFAGEPQDRLLKHYADSSEGLEVFGSRLGKRTTAVDRYDDSKFQTDASALPRQFFASKQGIADLVELTGNRADVVKAASSIAASELRDMNATQVRQWMTKRREMLSVIPEVRDAVLKYSNTLGHGETVSRSAEKAIERLARHESDTLRRTETAGTATARDAERTAAGIRTQAEGEAAQLSGRMGPMFPAQNVKALIEGGNTKQWELAAPMILSSPGGNAMFADALRQSLADKASQSTKGLTTFFENKIRPALDATKIIPAEEVSRISSQLAAIENMVLPEPVKVGMARRIVLQSFGGYAASVGARAGTGAATGLANLIPQ